MGISTIRFTLLASLPVVFAFATATEAQQIIPAAFKGNPAPAPVYYQEPVLETSGVASVMASPVGDCGCNAPAPVADGCSTGCSTGCDTGCGGGCGGLFGGLGRGCNHGDQWTLFGRNRESALNIGGWFQAGYHEESNDLFNNNPNEFNLHQGWLFVEKVADGSDGLGFGFRFDGIYGIDSGDTQAFGNSVDATGAARGFDNGFDRGADYGFAIPQAYLEVAGDNWSTKIGHFYTLVGYEVVTAPDNFFYSHAITNFLSEPFTHTGFVTSFDASDDVTLYAGWTLGWDTGFDQFDDGSNFIGGFSVPVGDFTNMTYITTIGDFGARGDDAYGHSFVFDTQLSVKFNWIVQSDLLRVGSTGEDNIGINQYLLYNINDCWGVGARGEWWKGDTITGYAPHDGVLPASGSHSYYAATFGLNYKPNANLIVRPEYRYDWSPALGYEEGYVGVDVIALY